MKNSEAKTNGDFQFLIPYLEVQDKIDSCETPQDAFDYIFSTEYLTYVFDNHISLKGGRGVDGINSKLFEKNKKYEIAVISRKVRSSTYNFSPYLEALKSKGRGASPRVLSIPTVRDRIALFALKEFIKFLYKEDLKQHHPNEYVSRLCKKISREDIVFYYRGDLKNFYPSIPQQKLINKVKSKCDFKPYITLLERALRTPTNSLSKKHPKQEGVPQGLSIANILADVYLKDLDRILNKRKVFYGRFVDDIVISGKKIPLFHAVAVLHIWLFFNGLRLGKEKSSYGRVTEGIDYLGYNVKKTSSDKVYVGVRKSSQQNLINSLCGLFTAYIKTEKIKHIYRLNRRITGVIWQGKRYGWLFYFLELNDLSILKKFDSIVSKQKKRYNLKEKSLKKFTNSFWRIKKNKLGQYITNFDNYSIDEMKSYLQTSLEKELEELNKYSEAQIRRMFKHEVQKEVDKMELDIGDIS